jgi:quercetin dioxygenase-like cupin family protein
MTLVRRIEDVNPVQMMEGVTMRVVIGPDDGAPVFNMRIFDVEPGAATPLHAHWWEHEVFILKGNGMVHTISGPRPIRAGSVVFVPGDQDHQFLNTGDDVLRFMCLVPQEWLEDSVGNPDQ